VFGESQSLDSDQQKNQFLREDLEAKKLEAASLSFGKARSPEASMDSATKSRFPGALANSVERPANDEGGAAMERDTLMEQGQTPKVPAATRFKAATPQASFLRPIKREHSPIVIDLTKDDDNNNNKRIKTELEEFTFTGTGGTCGTGRTCNVRDASRSLEMAPKTTSETEIWWPGKMLISKKSPPLEDHDVWWPGKLAELC
jgi:hypothetical protein